jgi:hypothetical protein
MIGKRYEAGPASAETDPLILDGFDKMERLGGSSV